MCLRILTLADGDCVRVLVGAGLSIYLDDVWENRVTGRVVRMFLAQNLLPLTTGPERRVACWGLVSFSTYILPWETSLHPPTPILRLHDRSGHLRGRCEQAVHPSSGLYETPHRGRRVQRMRRYGAPAHKLARPCRYVRISGWKITRFMLLPRQCHARTACARICVFQYRCKLLYVHDNSGGHRSFLQPKLN